MNARPLQAASGAASCSRDDLPVAASPLPSGGNASGPAKPACRRRRQALLPSKPTQVGSEPRQSLPRRPPGARHQRGLPASSKAGHSHRLASHSPTRRPTVAASRAAPPSRTARRRRRRRTAAARHRSPPAAHSRRHQASPVRAPASPPATTAATGPRDAGQRMAQLPQRIVVVAHPAGACARLRPCTPSAESRRPSHPRAQNTFIDQHKSLLLMRFSALSPQKQPM